MSPAARRVAVVDIGSNSVRLFLCTGIGPTGPEGDRITTVTGLRRGAAGDGTIAEDALARLEGCLAGYADAIAAFSPARVVAVGTSAVRDAPNHDRVAEVVRGRLDTGLAVLTGAQEARAAFAGARLGAPGHGPIMVVDIGGGSTELVRGDEHPEAEVSLQLGAVRHTERFLRSDPPAPAEVAALGREARALIAEALAQIGGPAPAVGVAGTITSLAAIDLGAYDPARVHGHVLTRARIETLTAELCAMTVERRRTVPGLDPARAGVIAAGALIARAVLDAAGAERMVVSERDLLDGVALAAVAPGDAEFRL